VGVTSAHHFKYTNFAHFCRYILDTFARHIPLHTPTLEQGRSFLFCALPRDGLPIHLLRLVRVLELPLATLNPAPLPESEANAAQKEKTIEG